MHNDDGRPALRRRLPVAVAPHLDVLFHVEELLLGFGKIVGSRQKVTGQRHGVPVAEKASRYEGLDLGDLRFSGHEDSWLRGTSDFGPIIRCWNKISPSLFFMPIFEYIC